MQCLQCVAVFFCVSAFCQCLGTSQYTPTTCKNESPRTIGGTRALKYVMLRDFSNVFAHLQAQSTLLLRKTKARSGLFLTAGFNWNPDFPFMGIFGLIRLGRWT